MNHYGFEPDFENLKKVLKGGCGKRVPNMELVIDREIKEAFLGKEVETLKDEIEFRYQAGYDYVWISVGMIDPAGTMNREFMDSDDSSEKHYQGKDDKVWAQEKTGKMNSIKDIENYPWPEPAKLDYSPFFEAQKYMHPGMKVIAVIGKIFTAAWEMMGLENFSLKMYDEPEMIEKLIEKIGEIQLGVLENLLKIDSVGAVWAPDDVAYYTGTMVPAEWLRRTLFPIYKKMAQMCKTVDRPLIYHSDGNLWPVLDTILDVGFDALHPIESESMDIYELREKLDNKICLIGNIRVHSLATENEDYITELVKDRVINLGHKGAYCVGSSNSVPNCVPLKNYKAMLKANADFGQIKS